MGSVTFLDGTVILGTGTLRHGKAILKTTNLHVGPNGIQAEYTPSQGFAASAAAINEDVRAPRIKSRATPLAETGRRTVPGTSGAIHIAGLTAIPASTVTIIAGPAVPGLLGPNQECPAHSRSLPARRDAGAGAEKR
jgi:hypothetical protein